VFFRATGINQATQIIKKIASFDFFSGFSSPLNTTELCLCFVLILVLFIKDKYFPDFKKLSKIQFYTYAFGLAILIYFLGVFDANSFIYFQF
jgi:alginate O-acetyltransferase complex protein AlgI